MTNFERFKKMKEDANKSKGPSDLIWFRSEPGKTYTMRFLPLKSQDLEFPVEVYHHHPVNFPDGHFEGIPCPKRIDNSPCPFCELATKSYKTYTKTQNEDYKEAFKKLVARTHYLLVGYDTKAIHENDIKQEDVVIVRASAKTTMDLIDNQLAKGRDFIDYKKGRNVELLKTASGNKMVPISWSFEDEGQASISKEVWNKLVEISPNLKRVVTPLSSDEMEAKFREFSSAPVVEDDVEDEVRETPERSMPKTVSAQSSTAKFKKPAKDDDEVDIDALRRLMTDDD